MNTNTKTIKFKLFFVLVGLAPTFALSGEKENVQKLDRSETSWAWNSLSPETRWTIGIAFFLFYWFYLFPEKKSVYELRRELRNIKRKKLQPLKIDVKIQENLNEINQNLKKYDQAVKEDNQQDILKTGLRLKNLKEDLDDLNAISEIQKSETLVLLKNEFEKIPPINDKPLVVKEEKLPLFEQLDKAVVDLENRKIIERQGGHLQAHKKNKVVLYSDEYGFRKQALYNKKNNINDIRTNALLETIEKNQEKAKKKVEKIKLLEQIILEKEKQPLKNKKDIEASKKKIEMHNRQIDELIRLDLKENLAKNQWDEIKELYPEPRQKEPETKEELENEVSRLKDVKKNNEFEKKKSLAKKITKKVIHRPVLRNIFIFGKILKTSEFIVRDGFSYYKRFFSIGRTD